MKDHKVRQGECLTSIADHYGFFWETLWNHAKNSKLKELRKNPNILVPGDLVHIPDKRLKEESGPIGEKHRFKLKGIPALFRVQLFQDGQPRANQSYELDIEGRVIAGQADAEGVVEAAIPARAERVTLTIGPDEARFQFEFGLMPPITEISGVQSRLVNLGFGCPVSGELDEALRKALRRFQSVHKLEVSGELDDATRSKIESVHDEAGSVEEQPAGSGAPA